MRKELLFLLSVTLAFYVTSCGNSTKKGLEQSAEEMQQNLPKETVHIAPMCQSCGMPMEADSLFGTDAEGSASREYCIYCYRKGKFVQECTMDEMIEHCAEMVDEINRTAEKKITKEEYVSYMKKSFPYLKRWKK